MINNIIETAKNAGNIIRESFGKNFQIEYKTSDSNLVTEIDKKSEKLIIDFIRKSYPNHSILAEESGSVENNSEYCWVIDPLDGTTNFAHGLPIFSVSIGLMKNNEIIAGVVYDVMQDNIFAAEKNSGAFYNNKRMFVSKNFNLNLSLLVTGFPYDLKNDPDTILKIFSDFTKNSRAVRRLGSAALDLCYVAAGVFDGFWEQNLSPWDICAGKLLVEEAGGRVTDFNGKNIDVFSKQILATNGNIEKQMIDLLQRNIKS